VDRVSGSRSNREGVLLHISCSCREHWWISLHALRCVTDEINTLFTNLQYKSLLGSQQREAFDLFIVRLREKFLLRGPLSSTQMASLDDAPKLCKGSFAVLLSDVSDLINGLGSSVSAMFKVLQKKSAMEYVLPLAPCWLILRTVCATFLRFSTLPHRQE
jgi:hypothetical protein